jgi:2-polyprenyl-3-methyl-5-hydroxy-6-metoxy-1,4-benzoquinol methylase
MIPFAEQYNHSDPSKWEERLKLIGFCLLVKREAYEAVGGLDERFTPGNYEDDDFCLRIRRAGYKLKICTDTFIHHEGSASFRNDPQSFNALMQANARKFSEKWGFSPEYSLLIRHELLQLLDEPASEPIRVLEVGCACGATLLEIKNWYPNAELHGIELNTNAAEIASLSANVRTGNIETIEIGTEHNYFDYIIFADVLEHLIEPWNVLHKTLPYLKENGKVLASIPNVAHYSVIRDLLKGQWTYQDRGLLDVTHLRFFTREGICRLFSSAAYPYLEFSRNTLVATQEDEDWINTMGRIVGDEMKEEWRTYQYLVKACKSSPSDQHARIDDKPALKTIVRRIEWEVEAEESLMELAAMYGRNEIRDADIADVIERHVIFPIKTASKIAEGLERHGLILPQDGPLDKLLQRKGSA